MGNNDRLIAGVIRDAILYGSRCFFLIVVVFKNKLYTRHFKKEDPLFTLFVKKMLCFKSSGSFLFVSPPSLLSTHPMAVHV